MGIQQNRLLENKYFTPNITDIRVGYECEIKPKGSTEFDWMPYIVHGGLNFKSLLNDSIRVPYLTKEQIRDEGWKVITPDNDKYIKPETFFFEKGNYFLVVRFNNKIPFLDFILRDPAKETDRVKDAERFRFFCECKDINTFRYICKLLNIK